MRHPKLKQPWKPGESGNPKGRPKLTPEQKASNAVVRKVWSEIEMIQAAREHTPAAIQTWVRNLDSEDHKAANQAAAWLLAYAWGKPKETVKIEGGLVTKDRILLLLAGMTSEQRGIIADQVRKRLLDVRRSQSASGGPESSHGLGSLPIGGDGSGSLLPETPQDAPVTVLGPDDPRSQQVREEYVRGEGTSLGTDGLPPVQDEPTGPSSDGEGDLPDPPD